MSDWAAGIAARLAPLVPVRTWRVLLAVLAGSLAAGPMWGGLAMWLPPVQAGALAGITVGLIAPSLATAAGAGAGAAVLGGLLAPLSAWVLEVAPGDRVAELLIGAAVGAAAGAVVRWAATRWRRLALPLVVLAVAICLANMWGNVLSLNAQPTYDPLTESVMPSFNEQLAGEVPERFAGTDDAWFYRVYEEVRGGREFYDAFNWALEENPNWDAYSVMDFRMPTFYLLGRIVAPDALPVVFLLLASLAVAAIVPVTSTVARLPLSVPAAAALAAYFLFFPLQLHLFSPESTAAAIGVLAVGTLLWSFRSKRWRAWCVAAVLLAVLATLVRETIVFVPLGGLAGAFFAVPEERRFRTLAWAAGVLTLAGAYLAHFLATKPFITYVEGTGRAGKGGFGNVGAALVYGVDFLGGVNALVVLLAVLGLAGALLLPDVQRRVFACVAVMAPLASFLVLGNRAWYEATGEQLNYWGATVVPLLYASVPVALTVLPGAGKGGTAVAAPRHVRARTAAGEKAASAGKKAQRGS